MDAMDSHLETAWAGDIQPRGQLFLGPSLLFAQFGDFFG